MVEPWENAPLVEFAKKPIFLEIFVERFEDDCHKRLIELLGKFCRNDSMSDRNDIVTQNLRAYDLDRFEGGIGFAPFTEDHASIISRIHPAYGKKVSEYDGSCCVRYVPNPCGAEPCYARPIDPLDESTPLVVNFAIGRMLPLRLFIELYRIFNTTEARDKLGCGQTRISPRSNIGNICIPIPIDRLPNVLV